MYLAECMASGKPLVTTVDLGSPQRVPSLVGPSFASAFFAVWRLGPSVYVALVDWPIIQPGLRNLAADLVIPEIIFLLPLNGGSCRLLEPDLVKGWCSYRIVVYSSVRIRINLAD
jgi:hypothetical protein